MNQSICYIVGAGCDYGLDFVPQPGDLVLAADGGLERLQQAGLAPDLMIGDFDSLGRRPDGDQVVVLPTEKDVTDTWAAIEAGKQRGYGRFRIYGGTGGRLDHTLANVQTVAHLSMEGLEAVLVDETQVMTAVTDGSLLFTGLDGGYVSVFSYGPRSTGVTLAGLKYPLDRADLTSDYPLGVSNEFTGVPARITVEQGTLLVVHDRKIRPADIRRIP